MAHIIIKNSDLKNIGNNMSLITVFNMQSWLHYFLITYNINADKDPTY